MTRDHDPRTAVRDFRPCAVFLLHFSRCTIQSLRGLATSPLHDPRPPRFTSPCNSYRRPFVSLTNCQIGEMIARIEMQFLTAWRLKGRVQVLSDRRFLAQGLLLKEPRPDRSRGSEGQEITAQTSCPPQLTAGSPIRVRVRNGCPGFSANPQQFRTRSAVMLGSCFALPPAEPPWATCIPPASGLHFFRGHESSAPACHLFFTPFRRIVVLLMEKTSSTGANVLSRAIVRGCIMLDAPSLGKGLRRRSKQAIRFD